MCFNTVETIDIQVKKGMKTVKSFIGKTFKKVRISKKRKKKTNDGMQVLLNKRKEAMEKGLQKIKMIWRSK